MIRNPYSAFRKRPVAITVSTMISATIIWIGGILLSTDFAPNLYRGPRAFFELHTWGWLMVISGVLSMARIPFMDYPKTNYFLSLPRTLVMVGWAISFDFGPKSTGQAIYTFMACMVMLTSYIPRLLTWTLSGQGFVVVPKENSPYSQNDYLELPHVQELRIYERLPGADGSNGGYDMRPPDAR
jgi:hypothetical protein